MMRKSRLAGKLRAPNFTLLLPANHRGMLVPRMFQKLANHGKPYEQTIRA
jgi:hypothetical protein